MSTGSSEDKEKEQNERIADLERDLKEARETIAAGGAAPAAPANLVQLQGLAGALFGHAGNSEVENFMEATSLMGENFLKHGSYFRGIMVRASEFMPEVQQRSQEVWMRNLLVLTMSPGMTSADPMSVWQVTQYLPTTGQFVLTEGMVTNPRLVTVSFRQLSECYVVLTGGLPIVLAGLGNRPGQFPNKDAILTAEVRFDEQLQGMVYSLRQSIAPYLTKMEFNVRIKKSTSSSSSSTSDEADKKQGLPHTFLQAAKLSTTNAGKLTADSVFRALRSGSLYKPPGDLQHPKSLNMSHAAAKLLVSGTWGDLRNFERVDSSVAEKLWLDKTAVAILPVVVPMDMALSMYREFIAVTNDIFDWTDAVLERLRAVDGQIRQLADDQRPINFTFATDNSVLELLNTCIRRFFGAITFSMATTAEVDKAIAHIRVIATDPWVHTSLLAIKERQLERLRGETTTGTKRDRDTSGGGGRGSPANKKWQAEGVQGICFMDCVTQDKGRIVGCRRSTCNFEHVRGKRKLTGEEKEVTRGRIDTRNKQLAKGVAKGQKGKFVLDENPDVFN
jgi:hypothetical protein